MPEIVLLLYSYPSRSSITAFFEQGWPADRRRLRRRLACTAAQEADELQGSVFAYTSTEAGVCADTDVGEKGCAHMNGSCA